ncbi:MAG: DUF541 domain-containing protein [Lutibacter sp.]|uniref:SIMPL domain-containing protein n=1 Tax=Lutibacter sp. TaxID=1925666 RepID=UPI0019DC899F|nr:SIMPL domain-containing protein [Lutibacter sp.]NOR28272.1 DUF541 domain-containing protein [Lutibacter sp.]
MKKIILLLVLCLIFTNAFSQTKNFIDQPYIETRAKVDTLVSPDRIYLKILISEKDTKGKISVEEFENKMAVKLVSLGVDLQEQLTLSDVASNFKKYFLRKQDILKSKAYQLVVYNAQSAGKVIVGLEEIGISNVQLYKTEYSKIEALKLNLKTKAIIKAKKQAEALLKPLNQKVGTAIYISDVSNYNNYGLQGRAAGLEVAYDLNKSKTFEPIDIDFKKIKIQSEIGIKFKIE